MNFTLHVSTASGPKLFVTDVCPCCLEIASEAVYSLHKTSTREYVKRAALGNFGAKTAEVLCELRYNLPAVYKFHRKQQFDIYVDLWRFTKER